MCDVDSRASVRASVGGCATAGTGPRLGQRVSCRSTEGAQRRTARGRVAGEVAAVVTRETYATAGQA